MTCWYGSQVYVCVCVKGTCVYVCVWVHVHVSVCHAHIYSFAHGQLSCSVSVHKADSYAHTYTHKHTHTRTHKYTRAQTHTMNVRWRQDIRRDLYKSSYTRSEVLKFPLLFRPRRQGYEEETIQYWKWKIVWSQPEVANSVETDDRHLIPERWDMIEGVSRDMRMPLAWWPEDPDCSKLSLRSDSISVIPIACSRMPVKVIGQYMTSDDVCTYMFIVRSLVLRPDDVIIIAPCYVHRVGSRIYGKGIEGGCGEMCCFRWKRMEELYLTSLASYNTMYVAINIQRVGTR